MSTQRPDALREELRVAMNNDDLDALRAWAVSFSPASMLSWQMLHEAWAISDNKSMLSWVRLNECIELAHDYALCGDRRRLSTLHAFSNWMDVPGPRWIEYLDEKQAHACVEQAVVWRRLSEKEDVHSMQALQTGILMELSIGCKQSRIWREYPDLKIYPLDTQHAMRCAEAARCKDSTVYDIVSWHRQFDRPRRDWKHELVDNNQMHNLSQVSATPFIACEYIIEQHAKHDNQESYAQLISRSQLSQLSELDAWMLTQLAAPSDRWETAGCPSPENQTVQAWWYLLQLGINDEALLHALFSESLEPVTTFVLPEDSFTPL